MRTDAQRVLIKAYNAGASPTATVEVVGAAGKTFTIAVNKALTGAMVTAGSQGLAVLFDDLNPQDGVLSAVW